MTELSDLSPEARAELERQVREQLRPELEAELREELLPKIKKEIEIQYYLSQEV